MNSTKENKKKKKRLKELRKATKFSKDDWLQYHAFQAYYNRYVRGKKKKDYWTAFANAIVLTSDVAFAWAKIKRPELIAEYHEQLHHQKILINADVNKRRPDVLLIATNQPAQGREESLSPDMTDNRSDYSVA